LAHRRINNRRCGTEIPCWGTDCKGLDERYGNIIRGKVFFGPSKGISVPLTGSYGICNTNHKEAGKKNEDIPNRSIMKV
jgi:hypothetical protein